MTMQGTVLAEVSFGAGHGNFRGLMPAIDYLTASTGISPNELDGLIVSRGPGSFTGLRVGLSAAKGMARGLGIPIVGVSSLEALAFRIAFSEQPVCSVLDSRKGELFYGVFNRPFSGPMIRIKQEDCIRNSDIHEVIESPTVFIGNDFVRQAPILRETLGKLAVFAPPALWHPAASAVGALGLERILRGEFDSPRDLVPVYFRPPDIRPAPVQRPIERGSL